MAWPTALHKMVSDCDEVANDGGGGASWSSVVARCATHPDEVGVQGAGYGQTALHVAVCQRHNPPPVDAVRALLGACPEAALARNSDGRTPLHLALAAAAGGGDDGVASARSEEVRSLLLEAAPAAVRVADKRGDSPLHLAAAPGSGASTALLGRMVEAYPAGVVLPNQRGATPFSLLGRGYEKARSVGDVCGEAGGKFAEDWERAVLFLRAAADAAAASETDASAVKSLGGGGSSGGGRAIASSSGGDGASSSRPAWLSAAAAAELASSSALGGSADVEHSRGNTRATAVHEHVAATLRATMAGSSGPMPTTPASARARPRSRAPASAPKLFRLLHAAASTRCPRALLRTACRLYPEQALVRDHRGRTPLVIAAGAEVYEEPVSDVNEAEGGEGGDVDVPEWQLGGGGAGENHAAAAAGAEAFGGALAVGGAGVEGGGLPSAVVQAEGGDRHQQQQPWQQQQQQQQEQQEQPEIAWPLRQYDNNHIAQQADVAENPPQHAAQAQAQAQAQVANQGFVAGEDGGVRRNDEDNDQFAAGAVAAAAAAAVGAAADAAVGRARISISDETYSSAAAANGSSGNGPPLALPLHHHHHGQRQHPEQAMPNPGSGLDHIPPPLPASWRTLGCGGRHRRPPPSAIDVLVAADPRAASVPDSAGTLPLTRAVSTGKGWDDGLRAILWAAPRALETRDVRTGMYPFMVAAIGDNAGFSTVYELVRTLPELVGIGIPTGGEGEVKGNTGGGAEVVGGGVRAAGPPGADAVAAGTTQSTASDRWETQQEQANFEALSAPPSCSSLPTSSSSCRYGSGGQVLASHCASGDASSAANDDGSPHSKRLRVG